MRKKTIGILILILTCTRLSAQIAGAAIGSNCMALGGQSTLERDVYAVFNNTALIGQLSKSGIGVFQCIPFGQKSMSISAIGAVIPNKIGVLGLGLVQQGNTGFSVQKLNMALAKRLSKQLTLGGNIHAMLTNQEEQITRTNFLVDLDFHYQLNAKWEIGLVVVNLTQVKYAFRDKELIPTLMKVGLGYQLANKIRLVSEYQKQAGENGVAILGLHYKPFENFYLQAGWKNLPASVSFGIGGNYKSIDYSLACSRHPVLGITPAISFVFKMGKEPNK